MRTRSVWAAKGLILCGLFICAACGRRGLSVGSGTATDGGAGPEVTRDVLGNDPPLIALVVDTTATCAKYNGAMVEFAKAALSKFVNESGEVQAFVVNLNGSPSVVMETAGDQTLSSEEEVDEFVGRLKAITYDGSGTDPVTAMDKVVAYRERYPSPSQVAILVFTDGRVESPRGKAFRQWNEFDWSGLYRSHAEMGFYFINNEAKVTLPDGTKTTPWDQINAIAPAKAYPTWKILIPSSAQKSLDSGDPWVPGGEG